MNYVPEMVLGLIILALAFIGWRARNRLWDQGVDIQRVRINLQGHEIFELEAKLDAIAESQDRFEERLGRLQATLDTMTMRPPGPFGGAPRKARTK